MMRFRKISEAIGVVLLAALALLAALKFGTVAGLPEEPGFFPGSPAGWLVAGFPATAFGLAGAAILFCALFSGKTLSFSGDSGKIGVLFGAGLPLLALIGAIHSPERWVVADYLLHYGSAGACVLGAAMLCRDRPATKKLVSDAAGAGAFLVALFALEQFFFGMDATRRFVENEIARGVFYPRAMLAKLYDDRVFATMTSANVLAGYLLLTSPVAVVAAKHFLQKRFPRAAKVGSVAAALLLGTVFLLTKTRGAFLAAMIAGTGALLASRRPKKMKIAVCALCAAAVGVFAWYIQCRGRGFSSALERASYVRSVGVCAVRNPLAGGGWGSFFLVHMQQKTTATGETPRDPHNIVLSFLAQCGIPAGIAVAGILLFVLLAPGKTRRLDERNNAVFFGAAAFLLHSMIEINHMVPGNLALLGILAVTAANDGTGGAPLPRAGKIFLRAGLFAFGCAVAATSVKLLYRDYAFARYAEALNAQDSVAAENAEKTALRAAPDAPFVLETAGDAAWKRRDARRAEELWREAYRLAPEHPSLCLRLAKSARLRGDVQEAERLEKRARELFPSRPIR